MIAPVKPARTLDCRINQEFLAMLPMIRSTAQWAFRHLRAEAREEAIQEVVASAYVAFARLVQQGRKHIGFGSALSRYAVAHYRAGRRTGSRLKTNDAMAPGNHRFIERLDAFDAHEGAWQEAVVDDTRTPVAEQACFRVDFSAWLSRLNDRERKIAQSLAASYSTSEVAQEYGLSLGRISQLRRELHQAWEKFHGQGQSLGCQA